MRGDPAIHCNNQPGTTFLQGGERRFVGAIALTHPVRDMHIDRQAQRTKHIDKQSSGGGTVDIIVSEHTNRCASLDSIGKPRRALVHILEDGRVRKKVADFWFKIAVDLETARIPSGKKPCDRQGHVGMAIGNGPGHTVEISTGTDRRRSLPARVCQRTFNTEKGSAVRQSALLTGDQDRHGHRRGHDTGQGFNF